MQSNRPASGPGRGWFSPTLPSERVNYLSHLAGAVVWLPLTVWLLAVAWPHPALMSVSLVYGASVIALFTASAHYHKLKSGENERSVRRNMDHFMIFVMIAGCYTPIIMIWFVEPAKWIMLGLQWGLTILGFVLIVWVPRRPRWVDPALYVVMGWLAVGVMGWLWKLMTHAVFWDLLAGGVFYTVGALIYVFKRPVIKPGVFGFHEFFHCLILAGAGVHFFMIYRSLYYVLGR
jgi:hemolysin III